VYVDKLNDGHCTDKEQQRLANVAKMFYYVYVEDVLQNLFMQRQSLSARIFLKKQCEFSGGSLWDYGVGTKRINDPHGHAK
jgi:hypothetical protein